MKPTWRRPRAAGFTYVEVTTAFAVLVVGVMGFATTVVYTGNLNRTTTKLWRENVAATGALEDVRQDAAEQWQSINATWDGHEVVADGVSSQTETLTTNVNDDPSKLSSSDGMWSEGSTTPNFYQVSVTAEGVNYQTYVADRTGFSSLRADAYQGASGGDSSGACGGSNTGTMAQRLDLTPRNVVVSGAGHDKLTFQLMNGSSTPVTLRQISVRVSNDRYVTASVGGTKFYDNPLWPIGSRSIWLGSGGRSLPSGLVEFSIAGIPNVALGGRTVTVRMRMKDGSFATATVRP